MDFQSKEAGRLACALACAILFTPLLAIAEALTLPQLQVTLLNRNSQLEQTRQQHKGAQAAVQIATAWSNPQIGLVQNPIPFSPFRIGSSQGFNYSLSQPFQLFGKKKLAGDIAQDQADAVGTLVLATEQQLLAQLKTLFYQLLALQHQEKVAQENIQRLEKIKQISKVRYANNAAAYSDYLNAQVIQSSATNDLFALQRQIESTRQNLGVLVGIDPRTHLDVRGELPGLVSKQFVVEDLARLALEKNPNLKGAELQVASAEKGLEYAKKSYFPDFNIGVTQISGNPPWGLSGQNYGVELDLVLPTWFFQKEHALEDQAQANLLANRAGRDSVLQQILLGVFTAHNALEQAYKQVEFIRDRQLPEAQIAWRLALQNYYSNNNQAFSDLLLAQSNLRNTELSLLQSETTAAQSWAALEAAVGVELELN